MNIYAELNAEADPEIQGGVIRFGQTPFPDIKNYSYNF